MYNIFLIVLLSSANVSSSTPLQLSCARDVNASAVAYQLSELPTEIRADLLSIYPDMGGRDALLRDTDAPTSVQIIYPSSRFFQAIKTNNKWFVQFEVQLISGVRTIGYTKKSNGIYRRSPLYYYGGPPCESIKAALAGVVTPGGFNF